MDINTLFIPDYVTLKETITLSKDISAIELVPAEGGPRLGQIALLPKGAVLEVCGAGFNNRSAKVRSNGRFYFVFLQDIGALPDHATAP
jgi:hypothetical protein